MTSTPTHSSTDKQRRDDTTERATIAKLLYSIANGSHAQDIGHDVIFRKAAELLEAAPTPPAPTDASEALEQSNALIGAVIAAWPSKEMLPKLEAQYQENLRTLAALSTPTPEGGDDWQPIETAPLNKTVLVCNPDEGVIPVVAKRHPWGWINIGEIPVGVSSGQGHKLEPAPLYWQPLPLPPRAIIDRQSQTTTSTENK